jgi:hypothetical protein
MSTLARATQATLIACHRYRDAPAAIDWLVKVFGFDEQLVVPSPDGTIAHAQLSFGPGMIMLGSGGRQRLRPPHQAARRDRRLRDPEHLRDRDRRQCSLHARPGRWCQDRAGDQGRGLRRLGFSSYDLEGHRWNVAAGSSWAGGCESTAHSSNRTWSAHDGGRHRLDNEVQRTRPSTDSAHQKRAAVRCSTL